MVGVHRKRIALLAVLVAAVAAAALAVAATGPDRAPLEEDLGGETTRMDATTNAFGMMITNSEGSQRRMFEQGDSFFTQNWVSAPASTEARDGLGPIFNAQSCASCHVLDARGAPPSGPEDSTTRGLLIRLSVPGLSENGAATPEPTYGGQFQDRSVDGVPAEGRVEVDYSEVPGTYADGTTYSLRQPSIEFKDLAHGPMHPDTQTSPRLAPQVIGMGLLEAIPEQDLVAASDPDDADGDGVSGKPNYVWNDETQQREIGRFGWKANRATVQDQAAAAFHGDIGITSNIHPEPNCSDSQQECLDSPNGGVPEIDDTRLEVVTFYTRTLAVPAMRGTEQDGVRDGAEQFLSMGCASCHTPTQQTGSSDISGLEDQTIHPYTDLLLHDMGPGLADNRPEFEANGQEWRTPPLWGLGLTDDLNGYRFLMHDGRARTIEEAILWHGGEGEGAKEAFRTADADQRAALIEYLEAL